MTNDQIENLEAFHWFNQLIQLVEPTELFSNLALNLQNKAQKKAASCLLANVHLFAQDPEKHYITISLRPATYTKDRYHSDTIGYRPFVTKVLPQFEKLKLVKLAKIGMTAGALAFAGVVVICPQRNFSRFWPAILSTSMI